MGIDVRLKRESGEVLAEVGDPKMVLSRATQHAFSGTRLLKYIVPWGDAVFNQAQAEDLESDIADVKRASADPQLSDILSEIEPLVARLSSETHTSPNTPTLGPSLLVASCLFSAPSITVFGSSCGRRRLALAAWSARGSCSEFPGPIPSGKRSVPNFVGAASVSYGTRSFATCTCLQEISTLLAPNSGTPGP